MTVRTEARAWVVPPGVAVWMPVDTWHEVKAVTALELRTLDVAPRAARGLTRTAREPVTAVTLDLGYASPSAFIAMFKRAPPA